MKKHLEQRRYLATFNASDLPQVFTGVLVLGSGAAGLRAGIGAARYTDVLIATKDVVKEGCTQYAQGGVAAALSSDDSIERHIEDTLEAGQGLCDEAAVRSILEDGPDCISELVDMGGRFDRVDGRLALTREGGHSMARIVHAKGDATGAEIQATLTAAANEMKSIRLMERAFAVDLITRDGVCHGAVICDAKHGLVAVWARTVVLATGGCGCLFRETTNPEVVTGDGCSIAYRAGAVLQDMEFVQFHPTTLYIAGASRALISEAVRGEGAVLRNSRGEQFMPNYHKDADLAPRDVVSRAIVSEMRLARSTNVFLDATGVKGFDCRFPTIYQLCCKFDIDVSHEFIPVRPSAHYLVGGVKIDMQGRTNVERLFAAGEVASTGLHGANRLGSNSLLEALVIGRRAGDASGRAASQMAGGESLCVDSAPEQAESRPLIVKDVENALRALMWRSVSIERSADSLKEAEEAVDTWCSYVMSTEFNAPDGWQLQDMLSLAKIIIVCARERAESRGVHFRDDFPQNSAQWQRHSEICWK